MNSVYDVGSTVETGAIRMPASPASTVAMTQFPRPIRFADRPISAAPCSFSAAAPVARPKRVSGTTSASSDRQHDRRCPRTRGGPTGW